MLCSKSWVSQCSALCTFRIKELQSLTKNTKGARDVGTIQKVGSTCIQRHLHMQKGTM